jgi:hypothetical protein
MHRPQIRAAGGHSGEDVADIGDGKAAEFLDQPWGNGALAPGDPEAGWHGGILISVGEQTGDSPKTE